MATILFSYLLLIITQLNSGINCKIIDETKTKICLTPACVKIASDLLDSIDFSTDPCQNFFDFTCGKWNKENVIPDDRVEYSINTLIEETVEKQMKILLTNAENETSHSKAIDMTRSLYNNCVNTTKVNSLQSEPLIKFLNQFGGWPILQKDWKDNRTDITELIGKIVRDYSGDVFTSINVGSNWKDPNKTMLYIDQGTLGLGSGSRDYYLNDTLYKEQLDAYKKYIMDVVKLLASDMKLTDVDYNQVDDLIAFEKKLANITVPEEDRRNYSIMYNPKTIAQLSEVLPYINWKTLFKLIFPNDVNDFIQSPSFKLSIMEPEFMLKLNEVLSKTSKKTITNYIFWRLLSKYISTLDVRYEDVQQDFARVFSGRDQKPLRWKHCIETTIEALKLASGALYVRKHFTKEDKAETLDMIKQLMIAMKDMIKNLDWMDSETKKKAAEKADTIRNQVGYPDFLLNDTALDDYYKKLDYKAADSYFEITKRIFVYDQQKEFSDLLKPFDRDRFEMSPAAVNAYYSPEKNSINFPAAILKFPYFQKDLPKYINYGATGATIGHEITHGFDDQGAQYDKFGGLTNWWSQSSFDKFQNKTGCMIKQYDQYLGPGTTTHISGERTVGENIADNGGLKEAYLAYLNFLKQSGKEELRLPGLDQFSNEQLFFMSYAYSWCGKRRPESSLQLALTDEHSPPIHRVNGVVVNSKEFSEVFKCKQGSSMNLDPKKQPKCSVW